MNDAGLPSFRSLFKVVIHAPVFLALCELRAMPIAMVEDINPPK